MDDKNNSKTKKKRILQLSNYYPPEIGGIEKIAQAISDSVREEFDVRVLCFTHEKDSRTDMIDGVKVIRLGTQLKLASQQLSYYMIKAIKSQIISYNPDIIILHAPNPFLEWILLKYIKPGCKLIVYWHSDIVKQKIGDVLLSGLTDKLLKRARVIVATSPNYIDGSRFLKKYRRKCVVIPNCIDPEQLQLSECALEISKEIKYENVGKCICVCVGRQVPYKGFEYAVKAFRQLDDSFVLYILGREGESTKRIKELATGSKNIVILGEVDNDTLHAYLNACDIFCFPSITKNEAFGIALAEGMYFNKPTVTFTIPGSGVNYVSVNEKTGIEVANGNVKSYAEAIRKLSENNALRDHYGNAAGERVRRLFLQKEFKRRVLKLLYRV